VPLAAKPKDITAGLDEEFTLDDIPEWGDGAKRYKTITKLPPVFQIYLQRQDFDHARQDAVVNKHHIQLEEVIYLDRFANPDLHRLREKSWELNSKLKKLRSKLTSLESTSIGMPGPDVLDSTWQFISTLGEEVSTDTALGDALQSQASARRDGIRRLTQAIEAREEQKRTLFIDHKQLPYRLAAVFMHRGHGGASGGHYWVYIRDFKSGEWRRYEDREVRVVTDLQEIYGEADPETKGAPYYVVYVREEQTEELVDAVCRIKPVEETADTQMEGTDEEPGDVAMETEAQEPEDGGASVPFEPKDEEEAFVPMIS
jgi:ubiquitin carboxyl-terminal hydrolase 25